jgi:hypothetical protein
MSENNYFKLQIAREEQNKKGNSRKIGKLK